MTEYTTVRQAKNFARIVNIKDLGFDREDDYTDHVKDVVEHASRFIDDYCKRPDDFFNGGATLTEYHDGKPKRSADFYNLYENKKATREYRRMFYLEHYPIISVTTVRENEASIGSADDWKTRAETDYRLDTSNGMLMFSLTMIPAEGFKNVEVVYKAGYATTPSVIAWVAAELTGNWLRASVADRSAQWINLPRPSTIEFATPETFSKEMKEKLKPYVKRR